MAGGRTVGGGADPLFRIMEAVANMADALLADGADTSVTLASLTVPALRGSRRIRAAVVAAIILAGLSVVPGVGETVVPYTKLTGSPTKIIASAR